MTDVSASFLLPVFTPPPELTPDGSSTGPEYTYQSDHVSDALSLLLSQFNDSTQMRAFLAAQMAPTQDVEDALAVLYTAFDVQTAVGAQLDVLGAIVGEQRNARVDSEFRAYVLGRIAANASDGSRSAIYKVVRLLLGTTNNALKIVTLPPAYYRLEITGGLAKFPWDASVPAQTVAKAITTLVTDATSVGVGFGVLYQAADDAHTFTLADADVNQADTNRGTSDDGKTFGGLLSDIEVGA